MLISEKIPDQVHWSEGMLLSPHHFQQSGVHFERQLAHQLKRVSPFYWGLLQVKFDEIALTHNRLTVEEFHGVMPDGTLIQFMVGDTASENGDGGADSLSIDLSDAEVESNKPFYVCVALPKLTDACASDEETELKRYKSVNSGLTVDQNDANNKVDVVRLRPVLRLVVEESLSPNYTAFPIARLEMSIDGSFTMLPYTPPLLSIWPKGWGERATLGAKIENLLARVRSRANQLRSFLVDERSAGFTVESQKQRIHYLTSRLPRAEVLLESDCHPFDLYQAMVEFAANLAPLNDDPVSPKCPKYNHDRLDETFSPVMSFIEQTIDRVRLDFSSLTFLKNVDDNFVAKISSGRTDKKLMLAFELPSGVAIEQTTEWVRNAYICRKEDYLGLEVSRNLGLPRVQTSEFSDLQLMAGAGEVFFSVEVSLSEETEILVSGSDKALERYAPRAISCFLPNETNND
jgi:type VI secretion system protein ImpJ